MTPWRASSPPALTTVIVRLHLYTRTVPMGHDGRRQDDVGWEMSASASASANASRGATYRAGLPDSTQAPRLFEESRRHWIGVAGLEAAHGQRLRSP